MNDREPTHEPDARQREAEAWYERLDDPDLQDKEWRHFIQWQSIPENQEAFDATATRREIMLRAHRRLNPNPPAAPRYPSRPLAIAMVALCVCLGIVATVTRVETQPSPNVLIAADRAAEWLLEDGSLVKAEPHTRLEVEFDDKHRSTRLRSGSAYFRVARAADRPFQVHTDVAVIEAVGTAFRISVTGQDAKVTVMTGKVAVYPDTGRPAFKLSANQHARIWSASNERVSSADVTRTVKSRKAIQFDNRPASDAVAEFRELSGVDIRVDASSPARASRVTGIFQFDDPIEFAQAVANKTSSAVSVSRPGLPPVTIEPARPTQ